MEHTVLNVRVFLFFIFESSMIAANVGWYVFFDDINIIYPLTLIKNKRVQLSSNFLMSHIIMHLSTKYKTQLLLSVLQTGVELNKLKQQH